MFFTLIGFGILAVMRGIIAFIVLFFILPAVKIIPDFRPRQIGKRLLFTLPGIFISGAFHKTNFW